MIIESKHYIFNFKENSCAHIKIDEIIQKQEACFDYICSVLKIKQDFKMEYYLCDTPEEVGAFYGDNDPCNGFARYPNQIYAVYNENVKCIGFHEDAHLISFLINRPDSGFIREGLAMFFDKKWWSISNLEWTLYYYQKQNILSVKDYLNDEIFYEYDCTITYPIAGFFTEYLILSYGIDAYLNMYAYKGKIEEAFINAYGITVEQMNQNFIQYLELFDLDEMLSKRIQNLLEE